ncbi:2-hydroxyglutaryl-CoA dehydratase [Sedimentibacter hydroxybenzoicus DSM 7310]|uniref:2-hydroxyglutaryl-CoA dehydratase n=1 Tax=Sedimentibacter hydroxybenzoicus DSM 7310 TaxID=1123245 RepID=A0A974BI20_SEDHY|nr:2-hydroxyglutaryl-CoA dehydratase [Sedimentibacter hydroxybenzoicus]NYB73560.1 2-hydroxyglutaryl-CoA dehydratase [Sedimentibacter hydroxybenzoicus DSM 7310]
MKVTFPHMGNVYLAAKALLDGLGIDYVIPPKNNKEALDIGTLHSPEEMCLPFKLMIGNYVQAIQKGADTIIIVGSCGPCRFGEYCELQMNLMKNLGYDLNFIVIDYPKDIGIKELYRRISQVSSKSNRKTYEKLKALSNSLKVIRLIDEIEEAAHMFAGYERNKGDCKHILNECKEEASKCRTSKEMINLLIEYKEKIKHVPIDINKNPLKIAVIGEIYTVIESYTNFSIEDKLMGYGVSSHRGLTPSWWVKNALLSPLKINSLAIRRNAKKYLPLQIGGHAIECVGEAVTASKEGYDGAIQIFPMGCMPEIVSKSILPTISKDLDFPVMSLVVDDMTGEAGYITRIEAFIDLLERRRESVLFRC